MRAKKNDPRLFTGNFHENVFHRQTAGGRIGAKAVGFDCAAITLQFGLQKILQLYDGWRAGRTRAEAELPGDERKSALPIEAADLLRGRRIVSGLRRCASYGAHERWLAAGAGGIVTARFT